MNLGSANPKYCFYLPNEPVLPNGWHFSQQDAVAKLIELNGNHWRKILTIMAKICAPNSNWKHYRDTQLLKQNERIMIGENQVFIGGTHKRVWHFLVGAVVSEQLSNKMDPPSFAIIDDKKKLSFNNQSTLITPYLDYRQYPNQLIAETRLLIASHSYILSTEISS
ncbi:hypothetical protein HWQ46_22415 [Shewanella sp. D64]|uniref:DUF6942 family protein n=1 Tax=unclassified Shewanella TaxID=196818 RepID=UPI0022BA5BF4|nr:MULTISPECIES: hypothetical protein [unclassified Shewanella]MEC4728293.1 hypothetical protein [Shewanella sp. D64]MEC4740366.1 hypothetical protein [Shewanella sp. E94]WBJ93334.1 hypothetical protein HWQ47_15435 [Shewanella sp. MTB7]